jgi:hypothetical protein
MRRQGWALRPLLLARAPHRLAVDGDPSAAVVSGRGPRHKTALERDRIELGQDDAQLVVRERAGGAGSKAPQDRQLGPAEARHGGHRLRPGQHHQLRLVERKGDLPLLSVVRQVLKMRQENSRLRRRPDNRAPSVIDPSSKGIRGSRQIQTSNHLLRTISLDRPGRHSLCY